MKTCEGMKWFKGLHNRECKVGSSGYGRHMHTACSPAPGGGLVMWEGAECLVIWSVIWSVSDYIITSLADTTLNNKFLGGWQVPPTHNLSYVEKA